METTPRRPVVVGLDRSPQCWAAVEYAAVMAERRGVPLLAVHAYEPSQYTVRSTVGWTPTGAPRMGGSCSSRVRAWMRWWWCIHTTRRK